MEGLPFPARALSWNAYDQDIQSIVSAYNSYLQSTPGFSQLDWHLVKAMAWTETGPYAARDQWETAPMQSANPGDLGWSDLMRQQNKMQDIVPPNLRSAVASARLTPQNNIAAGVGILLQHAAIWGPKATIDKKDVRTVTTQKGDSLYIIAKRAGTTEQVLKDMNAGTRLDPLRPGMVLKYAPAKTVTAITGWRSISPQSTYTLYNHHPGSDYGHKVEFLYDLIKRNNILN
ncbi:MAG: LysM peptidoglycan-binding domain-containing protein [Rhodospirillales bacterium]|nr:LysM peptidoglycan-binding domain-containing protein [Rhodospirillales bacterium]